MTGRFLDAQPFEILIRQHFAFARRLGSRRSSTGAGLGGGATDEQYHYQQSQCSDHDFHTEPFFKCLTFLTWMLQNLFANTRVKLKKPFAGQMVLGWFGCLDIMEQNKFKINRLVQENLPEKTKNEKIGEVSGPAILFLFG
ncbi:MAG: hypothetical protein GWM98_15830 [Nitrospinaceae bacterium]|nr:hypothetical protein [Nitrospinaceae bacterium]NIR55675.1 hypothetical protein [Nitrospinaceae bacterium]NIS86119.1 hypothetical protein [Nitrospinaceae bacterium]NIT82963.1 hypothetical protein [Nitrospinaceae bacterium]NIU45166.1 hypothetical protein [Nitrospinaceae bacterium]